MENYVLKNGSKFQTKAVWSWWCCCCCKKIPRVQSAKLQTYSIGRRRFVSHVKVSNYNLFHFSFNMSPKRLRGYRRSQLNLRENLRFSNLLFRRLQRCDRHRHVQPSHHYVPNVKTGFAFKFKHNLNLFSSL